MAIEFAYGLDGSSTSSVKDFPLDAIGVSGSGYNTGTANTGKPRKGDVVYLNAGLLRRTYNVASPKAIGVVEGFEFTGLGQNGDYAATNANGGFVSSAQDATKYPNGIAKVRIEADSVYRVTLKSGQNVSVGMIGGQYNVFIDTANNNDVQLDNSSGANFVFKVVDVDLQKNVAFVTISTNTLTQF